MSICKLWNACNLIQLLDYGRLIRLCNPASLRPLHRFIINSMGVVTMQDAIYTQGILGKGVGFLNVHIGFFFS